MRFSRLAIAFLLLATLFVAAFAYAIRYQIDSLLFRSESNLPIQADETLSFVDELGNEALIRRFGAGKNGCIVFFPGQHGNVPRYDLTLFPSFTAEGIAVFAIAYPGQDGARGTSTIPVVQSLTIKATSMVTQRCEPKSTVLVGRSLGAMLAAYAANPHGQAGLILEGVAPNLALAIKARLQQYLPTFVTSYLPISAVLQRNYSLVEALKDLSTVQIIIIQGALDMQAPLAALYIESASLPNIEIVPVAGAGHSDTYLLQPSLHVKYALKLLSGRP